MTEILSFMTRLSYMTGWRRGEIANVVLRFSRTIAMSVATVISVIAFTAACGGSSGLKELMSDDIQLLHSDFEEYAWDPLADGQFTSDDQFTSDTYVRSLRVEEFTRGLFPFIEYRHFDAHFESDDAMAGALQVWARDNIYIDEVNVSSYLYALMNVILLPPSSFEDALAPLYAEVSASTDSEDQLLAYYVDLAHEWLNATQSIRPSWLQIEP